MANTYMANIAPGNNTLEAKPATGDFKFFVLANQKWFDNHCHALEVYLVYLEAAEAMTTGIWLNPGPDAAAIPTLPVPGATTATGTTPTSTTPLGSSLSNAFTRILAALPQTGPITAAAAQQAVLAGLQGSGVPLVMGNALIAAVPASATDWSAILTSLRASVTGLLSGQGLPPAAPTPLVPNPGPAPAVSPVGV